MLNSDKIYSREELFQIQQEYYYGYKIIELNYKKNHPRGVSYDRYKVIKIIPDVSILDSYDKITFKCMDGIILIEMVENTKV